MPQEPMIVATADALPSQLTPKKTVREIASSDLLQGETELQIRHGDELYRLKLTRNGKLILQK
jgi:hemin uptake protein HemP